MLSIVFGLMVLAFLIVCLLIIGMVRRAPELDYEPRFVADPVERAGRSKAKEREWLESF